MRHACGPIRVINACADPSHIVILVHGTWAHETPWTKQDSPLIDHLLTGLGPECTAILARDWSGRNSLKQRDVGSAVLEDDLKDLSGRFPKAVITVIAHSHGGNVAGRAIAHLGDSTIGLVCFSTPFIRAHRREAASWTIRFVISTFLFLVAIAILIAIPWGAYENGSFHNKIVESVDLAALAWITIFRRGLARLASAKLKQAGQRLSALVNFKLKENMRLLIFRVADDEASAVLTAYRFLDWLLEKFSSWVRLSWIMTSMTMKMNFTNYRYGSKLAKGISSIPLLRWWPWLFLVVLCDLSFKNPLKAWLYGFWLMLLGFNVSMTLLLGLTVLFAVLPLGWSAVLGVVTETVSFDSTRRMSRL